MKIIIIFIVCFSFISCFLNKEDSLKGDVISNIEKENIDQSIIIYEKNKLSEPSKIIKLYKLDLISWRPFHYTLFFLGIPNESSIDLIELFPDYKRSNYLPGGYRDEKPQNMSIGKDLEFSTWYAGAGEKYIIERTVDGLDIYNEFIEELSLNLIEQIEKKYR